MIKDFVNCVELLGHRPRILGILKGYIILKDTYKLTREPLNKLLIGVLEYLSRNDTNLIVKPI